MEIRIIIVALFCLLMAAACHETHLNGSSDTAFAASVQAMNQEHTVTEAQAFGDEAHRGGEDTRQGRRAPADEWHELRAGEDLSRFRFGAEERVDA